MSIIVIGLIYLLAAVHDKNPVVRFTPGAVGTCFAAQVAGVLGFAMFLRLFISNPVVKFDISDIPLWRVALAGFEDAIFILPIFFYPKWKKLTIPFFSILFMIGHDYQGTFPMLAKLPYVFIGYLLAEKYGILTTMVAHSLNDIIAVSLLKILQ